jgi:hypothetical protein
MRPTPNAYKARIRAKQKGNRHHVATPPLT